MAYDGRHCFQSRGAEWLVMTPPSECSCPSRGYPTYRDCGGKPLPTWETTRVCLPACVRRPPDASSGPCPRGVLIDEDFALCCALPSASSRVDIHCGFCCIYPIGCIGPLSAGSSNLRGFCTYRCVASAVLRLRPPPGWTYTVVSAVLCPFPAPLSNQF